MDFSCARRATQAAAARRARSARPHVALAACGLLLGGCAAVPDLGPRPDLRPAEGVASGRSLGSSTAVPRAWPAEDWWSAYGDPQLSALVEEGLRDSPDLARVLARVRSAAAVTDVARSAGLPSLDVEASAGAAKQSYNYGIPPAFVPKGVKGTATIDAVVGFDLDLWGRNRAAVRSARSEAQAAALDLAQAKLTLSTSIADAYADLIRLGAERAVAVDAIKVREETRSIVADRVAEGRDTQAELRQAEGAIPSARSDLAAVDEAVSLTRNRLAALVGAGPDRGLDISAPTARATFLTGLPAGISSDLLGRRPDVIAARTRVEAAAARIDVARADFYPSLNLQALIGLQALGYGNLLKGGSSYGSAAPAISLPIFHGGELQGRYRGARADYDEAVAAYDGIVVDAFRQVADAAASRTALLERLGQSRQALAKTSSAFDIARLRYEGGLSTYLDVLTAQRAVLDARRAVADLEARGFALDVALVRALGGGFRSQPIQAREADTSKDDHHGRG